MFVFNRDGGLRRGSHYLKWRNGASGARVRAQGSVRPPAQPLAAWLAASPQALQLQRLREHGSGWTPCSPTGHRVNNLWAPWEPGILPNPHSPTHHPSIHPPIHPSIQEYLLSAWSCWAPHPLHSGHPRPHPHPLQWSSSQTGFVWPCCDFQTFDFLEKTQISAFLEKWVNCDVKPAQMPPSDSPGVGGGRAPLAEAGTPPGSQSRDMPPRSQGRDSPQSLEGPDRLP